MAQLWKVDIEKKYQTEYWTNVYYVFADDLAAAHLVAFEIKEIERAILLPGIITTKYRTSDVIPGTDIYVSTSPNEAGLRADPGGGLLPLFNVVRFDLSAEAGRPSRKYMRGVLTENDIVFNDINNATLAEMDANYSDPLEAVAELRDVDSQAIVDVQAYPFVGMRQLRRGSKRRAVPVLP